METISIRVEKKNFRRPQNRWVSSAKPKRVTTAWEKFVIILKKHVKIFCDNTSLVGYKYLTEPGRPVRERVFWIIIHTVTLCTMSVTIFSLWKQYIDTPVVTLVDSDHYPSNELDLPGVSICNINRMSRKAVEIFAQELIDAEITNGSFIDVMKMIHALGSLYETGYDRTETDKKMDMLIDEVLRKFYRQDDYDVTPLMKRLSPSCTKGIQSCYFRNKLVNCSDIFKFRKNQHGYCCIFNYVREPDKIITDKEFKKHKPLRPLKIGNSGITNGLSIVLEPELEDYFFTFFEMIGWKIAIFNSGDYPDNTSGGVSEVLISPATENFIQLTVKSFTSTEAVRSVPKEKRECIFSDEEKVLQANYTYSDCIVDCRAKAIWETCNCRPFSLPRRGNDEYSRKVCNTKNSDCIHRNQVKWWSVLPHEVTNPEEVENFERAVDGDGDNLLHCNSCYPACNDVSYYVFNDFMPLQTGYYQSELLDNLEVKDQSIVHIYFINFGGVRLKMDLGYYWYELLSNIGGICGIFIDFSLLSLVELGYFFLGFIYEICCPGKIITEVGNTIEDPRDPGDTVRSATDMQSVNRIYWNELLSQPRVGMKNKIVRPRRKLRY